MRTAMVRLCGAWRLLEQSLECSFSVCSYPSCGACTNISLKVTCPTRSVESSEWCVLSLNTQIFQPPYMFLQMVASGIVALFSGLSAASSGAHGSLDGMLAMLSAMRWVHFMTHTAVGDSEYRLSFLLGIGIGAEYPCGSVSASEQSEQDGIHKRAQHRWFALATSERQIFLISHVRRTWLTFYSLPRQYDWFWVCDFCFCAFGFVLDVSEILILYLAQKIDMEPAIDLVMTISAPSGVYLWGSVLYLLYWCSSGDLTWRNPSASGRIRWNTWKYRTDWC